MKSLDFFAPNHLNRSMSSPISLGLDFGTESVRAILVDAAGKQRGIATSDYAHGQITERLPGLTQPLPPRYALQSPSDWLDSASKATRAAIIRQELQGTRSSVSGWILQVAPCCPRPAMALHFAS